MPCYRPIQAYRADDGSVVFSELKRSGSVASLLIACGQCVGCRLERSRRWAVRVVHEASLHDENCFLTLTYSDDSVRSLVYRDFQLFMKRLRKFFSGSRVRFYMCGEYGEDFHRPHFHVCLFGVDFHDKVIFRESSSVKLYRSPTLESLWLHGFSTVGVVSFESAAYVARYCMKKITGDLAVDHYAYVDDETGEVVQRVPEFNHMSLKPGIGAGWFERFSSDVYPHGRVVVRGVESLPPRYYDKLYEKLDGFGYDDLLFARYLDGKSRSSDSTDERLKVREQVASARIRSLKRSL